MLKNTIITGFADEIHTEIKVQVKLLQELGIKFIEFRSANGKNVADYSLEEIKELKKYLWENDIHISAIGSPIGKIKITDEFEPHFEVYKKVVEIAKLFETPYIRMFSFYIPKGEYPETYHNEVFDRTKRMIDYAKKHNVILLHENEKDIYGDIAPRCFNLFKEFYCDNFKCTFDFANFVQCGQDTIKAYEQLKPYIEYIHIKDAVSDTGEVVPAGEGDGNVLEILKELDKSGYRGFLSLEPHLAEFAALKSLEKNSKQRTLTDGEAAYQIAYRALEKILL
ncbi:sugar phosphate isomerase/epimerase family protein [Anaerocolumna sp. MB42-C2]|uniref:sugar phosphate isomerase/epimerase family protein n=1 Tax=Anaerocolumna sp. MB42-C2 TaxID=3070997 RepID=UPI0027DF9010|nr:sugar phosphate isomerase/epimerase [Anaerocolumna sp. MB42-C2]WMJ87513.1 sugar phosphate isomerase/epimerase [Anaerocolumna sp. MB42-C2]